MGPALEGRCTSPQNTPTVSTNGHLSWRLYEESHGLSRDGDEFFFVLEVVPVGQDFGMLVPMLCLAGG